MGLFDVPATPIDEVVLTGVIWADGRVDGVTARTGPLVGLHRGRLYAVESLRIVEPEAVHTIERPAVRVVAKRQQRRDVAVGNQPHVAALAAIATVGATEGDGAFPTERDAARATIATAHVQLGFIDKSAHRTP